MNNSLFTVIDLVMTDSGKSSKIVKIDALKLDVDKIDLSNINTADMGERFTSYIKPSGKSAKDLKFGRGLNITSEALENAPSIAVVLKQLREQVGDSQIVMFGPDNYGRLLEYGEKCGITFPNIMTDILFIAQGLFGDIKRQFTPRMLAEYFRLSFDLCDVELLAKIYLKLLEKSNERMPREVTEYEICFTPLYREILRNNESLDSNLYVLAASEIRVLQNADLGEAFIMLKDMIGELRKRGIAYRLNGAINMSYLAYCAGITDVKPNYTDDYISRLVNPYRNNGLQAPSLCVAVDVEPANVQTAIELMREYSYHYATDRTLFAVQTADETEMPKEYELAKQCNGSVLEVTVYSSEELARYTTLQKSTTETRELKAKDVYGYVQQTPIKVFDNAEKYLKVLQAIKPKNAEQITLAMAICENGREDVLEDIARFREDERSLRPDDIAAALFQSCGVFMYQEQAMRILCELSGCSQYYADNIRRAMAKRKTDEVEKYKQVFLFGGEDVDGIQFGGCVANDRMVAGRNYWAEIYDVLPRLYLKAHAKARAHFFIECAKLQMQSET